MKSTWRWFGPSDPVTLTAPKQAGATGIVSSLHDLAHGVAWPVDQVREHQRLIKAAGLEWTVVESVPVSNAIKVRGPERALHIENFKISLRAIAACGIHIVCYNYIPLVDWMRTDLRYPLSSGLALRFDMVDFAACDLFILQRKDAANDYEPQILAAAEDRFKGMDERREAELELTVLAPLPGGTVAYSRDGFFRALAPYEGITEADYRAGLVDFLAEVTPVASELGIRLCIHPDDPPINLFGLPRVAGNAAQLRQIFDAVPDRANGLTFCVGSLGVRAENDLVAMLKEFGTRVHFAHLRNVKREANLSFYEAAHLTGSSNMVEVLRELLDEERRRREAGRGDWEIPMRPDHGHAMLDDVAKVDTRPGYTAIGRMKGLAELRGAITALEWMDTRH